MMRKFRVLLATGLFALLVSACDREQRSSIFDGKDEVKVAETAYPENVYFGDTHLHTSNSSDAFAFGVRLRYSAKLLPDTQLKAQERAYSSPIWYNPSKG